MAEKAAHKDLDTAVLKEAISPVASDDSMAEAGRKILLTDFIRMLENEAGSRTGEDIEHVHQMRVAIRRMRSVFSLLDSYYKNKPVRPFVEQLKRLANVLGDVRDLDVMIDNLNHYQSTLDEQGKTAVQEIIAFLDKKRKKARKRLIAFLDSSTYNRFINDFADFLSRPGKGAKPVNSGSAEPYQVRHVLPVIIHDHLATVRAYDTVLQNPDSETLHALRIEFKRLRYIVSYFSDVLGTSGNDFIKDVKAVQDFLGNLNDLTVAQTQLQELLDEAELDTTQIGAIQSYIAQLADEEAKILQKFSEIWAKFNTRAVQKKLSDALLVLR